MRTLKQHISNEKKVYVLTPDLPASLRFLADAELEGLTFSDGSLPSSNHPSDLFALLPNGGICYVGTAGRICFRCDKTAVRIDYKKYILNEKDYIIENK